MGESAFMQELDVKLHIWLNCSWAACLLYTFYIILTVAQFRHRPRHATIYVSDCHVLTGQQQDANAKA